MIVVQGMLVDHQITQVKALTVLWGMKQWDEENLDVHELRFETQLQTHRLHTSSFIPGDELQAPSISSPSDREIINEEAFSHLENLKGPAQAQSGCSLSQRIKKDQTDQRIRNQIMIANPHTPAAMDQQPNRTPWGFHSGSWRRIPRVHSYLPWFCIWWEKSKGHEESLSRELAHCHKKIENVSKIKDKGDGGGVM